MMTAKFTKGGYHRNDGTLLVPDLRRELGESRAKFCVVIHMEEIAVRT